MKRYRYMIVRHLKATAENLCVGADGAFQNHLPIHHILCEYHWTRLDDEFVLVNAEYPIGHHQMLAEHEHTLMLPHLHSTKSLHQHTVSVALHKHNHVEALLTRYNLAQDASMSDLLDAIEIHEGPLFQPIR